MLNKEIVTIKSIDGMKLDGQIDHDDNVNTKGVFILLHGCPSYKDEYGFYGYPEGSEKIGMSEFFSKRGYPTIRFNFRSQYKDVTPETMNDLSLSGMINDIEAAYLNITSKYPGKPVYIVATSFAGAVTILWNNIYNHDIKHIFFMCPLLEIKNTLRKNNVLYTNDQGHELIEEELAEKLNENGYFVAGGKKITREFFNEIMATNMPKEFSKLSIPSTIFHGDFDTSVDIKYSKEFINYNKNTKLIVIENTVHGFGPRKDLGYSSEERSARKYQTWQDLFTQMEQIIYE